MSFERASEMYNLSHSTTPKIGASDNFISNLIKQTIEKTNKLNEDTLLAHSSSKLGLYDEFSGVNSNENEILRQKNAELEKRIDLLQAKIKELKTSPITFDSSPDQAIRILALETQKERLVLQLQEKNEQLEELRLRQRDGSDPAGMESILQNMRAEIKEEYNLKLQKYVTEIDQYQRESLENKLCIESKNKELDLLEKNLVGLERRTIEDMEGMRKQLTENLWEEYEKKLNAKKTEQDLKIQGCMKEIETLTDSLKDWRRKCIELEEKSSKYYEQLNASCEKDVGLKRMINDYEARIRQMEDELEKQAQLQTDSLSVNRNLGDKVRFLEGVISDLEEKSSKADEQFARGRVLEKELEKSRGDVNYWKIQVQAKDGELSKAKFRTLDLENELKLKEQEIRETLSFSNKITSEPLLNGMRNIEDQMVALSKSKGYLELQVKKLSEDLRQKTRESEEALKIASDLKHSLELIEHQRLQDKDNIKILAEHTLELNEERNVMRSQLENELHRSGVSKKEGSELLSSSKDLYYENQILNQLLAARTRELQDAKSQMEQLLANYNDIAKAGDEYIVEHEALKVEYNNLIARVNNDEDALLEATRSLEVLTKENQLMTDHMGQTLKIEDYTHRLEKEMDDLTAENQKLKMEVKELASKQPELARLQERLSREESRVKELSVLVADGKEENKSLSQQKSQTINNNDLLVEENKALTKKVKDLMAHMTVVDTLTDQNGRLKDELRDLQQRESSFRGEDRDRLVEELKMKDETIRGLQKQVSEVKANLLTVNLEKESAVQNLSNRVQDLLNESNKLVEQTHEKEKVIRQSSKQGAFVEEELKMTREVNKGMNANLEILKKEVATLKEFNEGLQQDLERTIADFQKAKGSASRESSICTKYGITPSDIEHIVEEYGHLRQANSELEGYVKEIIAELDGKNQMLQNQDSGFKILEDKLRQEIEILFQDNTQLKQSFDALGEHSDAIQANYNALNQRTLEDQNLIYTLSSEIELLKSKRSELSHESHKYIEENQRLFEDIKRIGQTNKALSEEIEGLKQTVSEFYAR
jgi:DNA repair exonuclease SbcCD ATPase subunit